MASIKEVIEGLNILKKYVKEDDPFVICAEHDVIYSAPHLSDDTKVSPEDAEKLKELGWHEDEEGDSWACFT